MLRLENSLTELAVAFKEELTDARKKIYLRVLMDLPLEVLQDACDTWLASDSRFFPKPGQLRHLAMNVPGAPEGPLSLQARAARAWFNLRGSATQRYNRWALADPLTRQVFHVMGGGYVTEQGFGNWLARWEGQKQREFIDTYSELGRQHRVLPPLPTEEDSQKLNIEGASVLQADYDDSERSTDEYRGVVQQLIATVMAKLTMPVPHVPHHYLREQPAGDSLKYESPLSPEELVARKRLLARQFQTLLAIEVAEKHASTTNALFSGKPS
jgi:hypothetical protein